MRRLFAMAGILAAAACARSASQEAVDGVVAWSALQGVPAGTVRSLRLPAPYASLSVGRHASVAHLKDGRTCVLVVTTVGLKDNFEGVLSCSAPLRRSEVVRSENYPRTYVSLPGYGEFEELYISSQRNDRTYDVYFDLN